MTAVTSVYLVAESVKTPRSSYRQEQADATRLRIADAAQRLFARDGYGATSMDGIAREAGVGTRTVYAAFGAKREILSVICERWLERARARERGARGARDAGPGRQRVRGSAGWLAALYSADFDVVRVLDAALDEDEETRELLASKLRGRNRVMDRLIASVEPQLSLSLHDAQSIFRAFAAPGVYGALVIDAGWSPERFESWLADTMVAQLLRGPAPVRFVRRGCANPGRCGRSVGGAHAHQVVDEHGRGARALAGGDDELLRARGGGIPRSIETRDAGAARSVDEKVPVAIAVDIERARGSRGRGPSAGARSRPRSRCACRPAGARPTRRRGRPRGRRSRRRSTTIPDAASSASSTVSTTSAPFVKTVRSSVQRAMSRARAGRSGVSPMSARGRSCSSHASQAAQLKSVMP